MSTPLHPSAALRGKRHPRRDGRSGSRSAQRLSIALAVGFFIVFSHVIRAGVFLSDIDDPDAPATATDQPGALKDPAVEPGSQPRPIEERIAEARARVTRNPDNAVALSRLAHLLLAAGRPEEALEYAWRAARARPDDLQHVDLFGFALLAAGDHRNGIRVYEEIRRRHPSSLRAAFNLASAYHALGKTSEALNLMQEVVQKQSKDARVWYNLGVILMTRHDHAQAGTAFQQALDLQPRQPVFAAACAIHSERIGDVHKAELYRRRLEDLVGPIQAEILLQRENLPLFLVRRFP